MSGLQTTLSIAKVQRAWQSIDAMVLLRPISTAKDHTLATAQLDRLLEAAGEDETHPLSGLIEVMAENISRYEKLAFQIVAASPHEVLQGLMEARGLNQSALQGVVHQSNLSAILAGKRGISTTLAAKLADFFDVNPGVFISGA